MTAKKQTPGLNVIKFGAENIQPWNKEREETGKSGRPFPASSRSSFHGVFSEKIN